MLKSFSGLAAVATITLISGCGGSGTGQVPLSDLITEFGEMSTDVDGPFSGNTLPTTRDQAQLVGSASYDGIALVTRPTDFTRTDYDFLAIGDARARVDFAAGTLRGSADNFYEIDTNAPGQLEDTPGVAIPGSLTFTMEDLAPQSASILYAGSASLALEPIVGPRVSYETAGLGVFQGAQAQQVLIDMSPEDREYEVIVVGESN